MRQTEEEFVVQARNISKRYPFFRNAGHRLIRTLFGRWLKSDPANEFWALKDVSFSIPKGIAFGVIGRNGAGKSTLLQILAGTLQPSSGEVTVRGRVNALLELGSGFNPEFTGRENVYLNGSILGFSKKEIDQKFNEILEFSEIADFIDQPVKNYSSGMFVKLAFSVQCCLEPEVLIVDEALSVGDIFFVQKCHDRIEKLIASGTTVLMVTHDLGVVERYCHQTLLLKDGNVQFLGETTKAISLYYANGKSLEGSGGNGRGGETDGRVGGLDGGFDISLAETIFSCDDIDFLAADIKLEGFESRRVFEMSSWAEIIFYVKAKKTLENPIFTIDLNSKTNLTVHAKSTLQFGIERNILNMGDIIKVKRGLKLDLMPGEYSLTISICTLPTAFYESAMALPNEAVHEAFDFGTRLKVGSFSIVVPRKGVLPFYGVTDLDGHMEIERVY